MAKELDYNERAAAAIESRHLCGRISKLYGKQGELAVRLYGDLSVDQFIAKMRNEPLWVEIDAIATPFFATSVKGQGVSGAVVVVEDIDNERLGGMLVGANFYIESVVSRRERADDWSMLEGCRFVDVTSSVQGRIKSVIDNSLNPLLEVVTDDGAEFFVPIAEELISGYNKRKKIVQLELVDGFFEANS